jgi:hypothetical protein
VERIPQGGFLLLKVFYISADSVCMSKKLFNAYLHKAVAYSELDQNRTDEYVLITPKHVKKDAKFWGENLKYYNHKGYINLSVVYRNRFKDIKGFWIEYHKDNYKKTWYLIKKL